MSVVGSGGLIEQLRNWVSTVWHSAVTWKRQWVE